MDFYNLEAQDGVRLTWNNLPTTKLAQTRCVLPIAIHYTPYRDLENLASVEYDPLLCKCGAIINPKCQVDFRTKQWICVFCNSRIPFPATYASNITEQHLPAELIQQYCTIEYCPPPGKPQQSPNVFLYMIDLCLEQTELKAMKEAIQESLSSIPKETFVGLITFGRFVFVHELGFQECPKSYALKGSKEYTSQQIQEMLGISVKHDPRGMVSLEAIKRFLLPIQECEFTFNSILDDLQCDAWPVGQNERPLRATGGALNVAISILEACPIQGTRVMLFTGGPCTIGQGQVVSVQLEDTIRGYLDIQQDNKNCTHLKSACKYYQALSQRAVKSQQVIDIYGFAVDQFGLLEMRSLSEKTGGYIIMNEEFNSSVFKETYQKIFAKDPNDELKMCTAAKIEMFVSKELKISGALGQCQSLKKNNSMVAEFEIGQGGTSAWYIGGLDRSTTLTVMIDLNNHIKETNTTKFCYAQFQTVFKSPTGVLKRRVTTIQRRFADPINQNDLVVGFDQEAACVMMARYGVLRAEQEEPLEILKWLDRSLIRLVSRFGDYKKDDPNSFTLSKQFLLYPQFMYHLRRSNFIQTFGASPDEIIFYRATMNRENTTNCLVMIQPALLQYTCENPVPLPASLDIQSLKPNVILLLDSYFQVITWMGDYIKEWKRQNFQEKEEYASFKLLLESPMEDVKCIMEERFPVPIYYETNSGHTKERYIKSRLIPSPLSADLQDAGHYMTDDASLKHFMDHLMKLAVTSQN